MTDDELLAWAQTLRSKTMKDLYVLTMAMTTINRPGARKRAVNAARRLHTTVKELTA